MHCRMSGISTTMVANSTLPSVSTVQHATPCAISNIPRQVRGIGRWTADMFAMFHLGRPDVLPVGDLGVRKGFQILYGLKVRPQGCYSTRQPL